MKWNERCRDYYSSMTRRIRLAGLVLLTLGSVLQGCNSSYPLDSTGQPDLAAAPPEAVPDPEVGVIFIDVTDFSGIHFVHSFGDRDFSNLVEAVGSGVAFLDYDSDGNVDLFLSSGAWTEGLSEGKPAADSGSRLFRNRGQGRFEDVTASSGIDLASRFGMGVAAGDFDNDGNPDLYVCGYGRSSLLRNNGDGTFTDVARAAGLTRDGQCTVAATWLDYDGDGLLDLYASSYIDYDPGYTLHYAPDGFPGPLSYRAQRDHLYRNLGDSRFQDVSVETGIAGLEGRGMSVSSIDLNQDSFPDLYVTNDGTENFLLQNEGGRRFSQVALESGVGFNGMGDSTASMGVDFGDFDGDGLLDLFVSDNALSSLYHNQGGSFFVDAVVESGIAVSSAQFVGWGSFFFDFDNDSDLDILKVNSDLSRLFGQEDQLFANQGNGRFVDVSGKLGEYFGKELLGRGAAYADYDNDGDLDALILNIGSPAVLLRNDGGNRNSWIALHLVGRTSNRDAIGARVSLRVGGRQLVGYRRSTQGYLSSSDPRLYFGLGSAKAVDEIEIRWPSGATGSIRDVKANQVLRIEENS